MIVLTMKPSALVEKYMIAKDKEADIYDTNTQASYLSS